MKARLSLLAVLILSVSILQGISSVKAQEISPSDIEWIRQFGSAVHDEAKAVTVTAEGVYITGHTLGVLPGQDLTDQNMLFNDLFVIKYDFSGNTIWTKQIRINPAPGRSYSTIEPVDMVSDSTGIYVMGWTNGVFSGETYYGGADIFIVKFDFDGSQLWVHQFGTTATESPRALAIKDGKLFVAGATDGRFEEQPLSEYEKLFVLALNQNGEINWAHRFGHNINSFADEWVFDVAVDNTGIYLTGNTRGTYPDEVNYGGIDAYLRKYDFDGNVAWTRQIGTVPFDYGGGVATAGNAVYVAGTTGGRLSGETKIGAADAYIQQYDQSGNLLWTRQFGTTSNEGVDRLIANEFGVYCTGSTYGVFPNSIYAFPGTRDNFACGFDSNGNQLWVTQYGSSLGESPYGIIANASSVFVAGMTTGSLPGQLNSQLYYHDAYLLKINAESALPPENISFSPSSMSEGAQVSLTGYADTTSTLPITFEWDLGNDGVNDFTGETIYFDGTSLDGPYEYPVKLTACTGELCASQIQHITIENIPPTGEVVLSEYSILTGEMITVSVGNVVDLSIADQQAGFAYSFDCENDDVFEVSMSSESTYQCSYASSGTYTVLASIADKDGDITEISAEVLVEDPLPPVAIAGEDQGSLEGEIVDFDASQSFDPDGEITSFLWSFGDGGTASGVTSNHIYEDNGTYIVTLEVIDTQGLVSTDQLMVTVENVTPVVQISSTPTDPIEIGNVVAVDATFSDPGSLDTFNAIWSWGDGTITAGIINEYTVSGTHLYQEAGVYTITLTVTDDDDDEGYDEYQYIVIYDPSGGFVTGNGWFISPVGAYQADPLLSGKASFGFVSKYQKGAQVPSGRVALQFKVADFSFNSTSFQWLVVAGEKAQLKGFGTINRAGNYGFIFSAIDGDLLGNKGDDQLRIKIWDTSTGQIVYDNQLGDADDASPAMSISAGSIIIHK